MAKITKKFQELVAKVVGSNVGELLRQIGTTAVQHAYSGNCAEHAQYALDTLPDAWRDPLATWLRARGVIVNKKAIGSSRYIVGEEKDGVFKCVKSARRQQKALEECSTTPVLEMAQQSVAQAKPKKSVDESVSVKVRAEKAAERAIKALKKADPDAAALLNERLTARMSQALVTPEGDKVELSPEEFAAAMDAVRALRTAGKTTKLAA